MSKETNSIADSRMPDTTVPDTIHVHLARPKFMLQLIAGSCRASGQRQTVAFAMEDCPAQEPSLIATHFPRIPHLAADCV